MNVFNAANMFNGENVFDAENVFDSESVFDFVNVFKNVRAAVNVIDSVNVSVAEKHSSRIVPLDTLRVSKASLSYDSGTITVVSSEEGKALEPNDGGVSP